MASNLGRIISYAAKKSLHKTALIEASGPDTEITYRQLEEKISLLASQMVKKGLKKGERVGVLSRNSISSVAVCFAVFRAGGITVFLNHNLHESALIRQAKDAQLSALYSGEGLLFAKGQRILKKVKSIRFAVDCGLGKDNPGSVKFPSVRENDPALIVYTSGTTAEPLGVMLSHKNILSNSRSIIKYLNITTKDRACCILPFYYIYGLSILFSHLSAGASIVIENRFLYPALVLDSINKYKVTGFAGTSSHYAILLYKYDFKKRKLPSLKYLMQAGDAMPPAVTQKLSLSFPDKKLYIMYGQTEASPRLTYLNPDLALTKPESVGRPIPGVRIKIVDKKGAECKIGEKGEIIAKGDNIMLGYWNNKRETAKVLKKGWLYTGDIGYNDQDGDIFIVGRKKNFIKIGANRVSPLEIERLIMGRGSIMEAAVVGIPDKLLGFRIKVYVVPLKGKTISPQTVINLCKDIMPSYEIPSKVVILKSLPKNSYGKVDKEKLRLL
ncbi:MAG: acyl--CoA ligase [Candidatus Omnitrophica bacterium]|nr:acyl--CoA ligase [Candidatus Omnitrophota bacterium]